MNEIKIEPICCQVNKYKVITTNALMHELNNERYEFKKNVVSKCFLIKPRQESDLNIQ
jgi:hypothetical protein